MENGWNIDRPERLAWADMMQGIVESIPILLGVIPFGIACGIMGLNAGLTGLEVVLMSMLVFAGASQFISITMLAQGITNAGMIALTTLLINLRHLLMGASLAPYTNKLPAGLQALLAFGLVDETYAITITKSQRDGYKAGYQLGSNLTAYCFWVVSTIIGVVLGSYITDPLAWGLDFAMPVTFLALLVPRILDKKGFSVFCVSAFAAVVGTAFLPGKWYIIIACMVAGLVGGLLETESTDAV